MFTIIRGKFIIRVEEILNIATKSELYPIDGAIDGFVDYIMNLDISTELKADILCRYNSSIAQSNCIGISNTMSEILGVNRDKIYADTLKQYRKAMMMDLIKYRTDKESKDEKI